MKKKKYISYNPKIIEFLAKYGFRRKNKDFFVKQLSDDIAQSIIFSHSTHGCAHAKYYAIRISIELPKAQKIAENFDVIISNTCLVNTNIGELMPEPPVYLEWLITEESSEKYDNNVVDSMLSHIKEYAIPYLDRYSTTNAIIEDIMNGMAHQYIKFDDTMSTMTLLLYGEREQFFSFIKQRSYELQHSMVECKEDWDYNHPNEPLSKPCELFIENIKKLRPFFEENDSIKV